jgi:uncharacterized tellurite resistance protein B-like protein
MSLLQRLGFAPAPSTPEDAGLLDAIDRRLGALGPERAGFVAAFAALLARVAYADGEISQAESERIAALVAERGRLSAVEARAIADLARHRMVALGGADNHLVLRRLNESATAAEKRGLVDCLYAVATSDDLVSFVEDREVRRIADALLLARSEVLEIRSRYREKLEELQLLRKTVGRGGN